jgi:hypothetical protein
LDFESSFELALVIPGDIEAVLLWLPTEILTLPSFVLGDIVGSEHNLDLDKPRRQLDFFFP